MKTTNNWVSWLVLTISLLATFAATIYVKSEIDKKDEAEFRFESKNIAEKLKHDCIRMRYCSAAALLFSTHPIM
ncbi:hypothetical protein SAMN06265379_11420 [Saccharicrinis carchari]|uniref:Uncharacterized protein n=1 Tax=Saccharicrinis carchari TaxID=1168039 RepID=A0A521F3U7_SACCC|nr:hypothetical protein [Saccharicrinis carchari]SMO90844.1 hypothetical protein SAMN06265379_11420 [Saccharicrinis carchari]